MIGDGVRMNLSRIEPATDQGIVGFFRRRLMEAIGVGICLIESPTCWRCCRPIPAIPASTTRSILRAEPDRPAGAYLADFALQALGFAAIVPALALVAWGWRLIRLREMPRWWLKLLLLPVTTIVAAVPLAALPASGHWPWVAGYGGFVGRMTFAGANDQGGLVGLLNRLGIGLPSGEMHFAVILGATSVAFTLLFFTLGIAMIGYITFGRNVAAAGRKVGGAFDRRKQDWVEPARRDEDDNARVSLLRRVFGGHHSAQLLQSLPTSRKHACATPRAAIRRA